MGKLNSSCLYFEAIRQDGSLISDTVECDSEDDLKRLLKIRNLVLLSIKPVKSRRRLQFRKKGWAINQEDFSQLIMYVSVMLKSGLTLEQSIYISKHLVSNKQQTMYLDELLKSIQNGTSFSASLIALKYLYQPPPDIVGIIAAGENSGAEALSNNMERISVLLSRSAKLKSMLRNALIYPAFLITISIVTVLIILLTVVPHFEELFNSSSNEPSLSLKFLISASHSLQGGGLIWLLPIPILIQLTKRYWCATPFKNLSDNFFTKLPLIKPMIESSQTARYFYTFGELVENGLPITDALDVSCDTLTSTIYRNSVRNIRNMVLSGISLSKAIQNERVFSPAVYQIIRIGEETGQIGAMSLKIADIFYNQLQARISFLTTILSPLLTLFVGGIIAIIVAVIISAILSTNDLVM